MAANQKLKLRDTQQRDACFIDRFLTCFRFDGAVLVSLHCPVDPQTENMSPQLFKSGERTIPYMFVDNAAESADPTTLFWMVGRMLRYSIGQVKSGKNTEFIEKQLENALKSAQSLHVSRPM